MDAIAHRYLHIETVLLLPFLAILLRYQTLRSVETIYTRRSGRLNAFLLFGLFTVLVLAFGNQLANLSPLLALELAAGIVLGLLHPVNALCFFAIMLFLRPWNIIPDHPLLLSLPRLLAGVSLASWLIHPARRGRVGPHAYKSVLILLAFSVWLFLSTLITPHMQETQAAWFDNYFKCLTVFLMCAFFIENEHSLNQFKATLIFSIFSMAVLGVDQFMSTQQDRLSSVSYLDPNDLAAISVILVPMAMFMLGGKVRSLPRRIAGALTLGVALVVIWYSQSRGALLALVLQLAAFQWLRNISRQRLLTATVFLGLIFAYPLLISHLSRDQGDLQESSESRKVFWKAAIRMTVHNPLLGVGYEQYPYKYESYTPSMDFWGEHAAHSSWLLAFAESGVLGGTLFLVFFIVVFKSAWRHRKERPDQLYAIGGYGVAMSFLSHTYFIFPYLLYGLIMATDSVKEKPSLVPA
jgi:O-antigen ligase